MARVEVTMDVAAPAELVWARLTDWPSHGDWIPMTTVRLLSERADGVGAAFVARTGLGPAGFDDPMVVTDWRPPGSDGAGTGSCRLNKTGRVVTGWAAFEVEPRGRDASRIRWHEQVELAPFALTRRLEPLLSAGGRAAFALALRRFRRQVERGT